MSERTAIYIKGPACMIVAVILVLTIGCNEDECSQEGAHWCEDDIEYVCENDGSSIWESDPPNYLIRRNCTEYGGTCIEEIFEGERITYCGYTEKECPDGISTLCIGTFKGLCDSDNSTFPIAVDSSLECVEQNWDCVEAVTESNYIDAICTYITEPCEPDGEVMCHEGEFGNNILRCENGVWVPSVCDATEPCCILESTGGANCVDIEDHDDMCV